MRASDLDWGSVPDWLILLIALVGTILALRQLGQANAATAAYIRAEQGTQLITIDGNFEGESVESRRALVRFRIECQEAAGCSDGSAFEAETARRLERLVAEALYTRARARLARGGDA